MTNEKTYTIDGERMQDLIMQDLEFMNYYYHEYTQAQLKRDKEYAYRSYRRDRALLRRMLRLQGLNSEEVSLVIAYLRDLTDVIHDNTYKMVY